MGRTRNIRGGRLSNEALIKIIGAPSIVPLSFTAVARLDQSWYEFLAGNGLKVTPATSYCVRTASKKSTSSGGRPWIGFGAELKEKVGTFLNKFKYKNRKQFVVRLMWVKPEINFKRAPVPPPENVQRNRLAFGGCRLWGGGTTRSQRSVPVGTAGGGSGQLVLQEVKLEREEVAINNEVGDGNGDEVPQQEVVVEEDEDDNMSGVTSASQEEVDLRRRGIRSEDLKNPARGRFNKFENGYLLRARQEVKKLKERNLWTRNYQRAPLACYLLEEILKP